MKCPKSTNFVRVSLSLCALLPLVVSLVPSSAFARNKVGKTFRCASKGIGIRTSDRSAIRSSYPRFEDNHELDFHVILGSEMMAHCEDRHGNPYSLYYAGGGPGLAVQDDYFVVTCPLVSRKRFEAQPADGNGLPRAAWFGGVKVTASAGGGVTVGVFVNQALGVCVMTGVNLGIGAGATAGAIAIKAGENSFVNADDNVVIQ